MCVYVCIYVCVCVSPSRQWRKIQRDRKSIWKKLSRLSVYSSTVSYLYSLATLSLSLSLFLLFLFFIAGVWTPVARNTSRFWRFALCDQFQFQLLKVFKVNSPAMDSPLCVVFLLSFFSLFFPPPPPEGKLSLTQSTKLFYNFSSIFFSLFPPLFTRIE